MLLVNTESKCRNYTWKSIKGIPFTSAVTFVFGGAAVAVCVHCVAACRCPVFSAMSHQC